MTKVPRNCLLMGQSMKLPGMHYSGWIYVNNFLPTFSLNSNHLFMMKVPVNYWLGRVLMFCNVGSEKDIISRDSCNLHYKRGNRKFKKNVTLFKMLPCLHASFSFGKTLEIGSKQQKILGKMRNVAKYSFFVL